MYQLKRTNQFKRSFKRCIKRGLDVSFFENVVDELIKTGKAPVECRPHKLNSKFNYAWECHIAADWLLVWDSMMIH